MTTAEAGASQKVVITGDVTPEFLKTAKKGEFNIMQNKDLKSSDYYKQVIRVNKEELELTNAELSRYRYAIKSAEAMLERVDPYGEKFEELINVIAEAKKCILVYATRKLQLQRAVWEVQDLYDKAREQEAAGGAG